MIISGFILVIAGYLIGSIPHLHMLGKASGIELDGDFHQELWHRAGRWYGVAGVTGEFIKGITPVLIGKALGLDIVFVALAGVAAVCGQMWPVFARFDGEKGNSIAIGMSFALVPAAMALALIFVIVSLIVRMAPRLRRRAKGARIIGGQYSRSLPLGMVACFAFLPVFAWLTGEPAGVYLPLGAMFVLMIIIRRLTAGLFRDLETGERVNDIVVRRLLYDRSTVAWRQNSGTTAGMSEADITA